MWYQNPDILQDFYSDDDDSNDYEDVSHSRSSFVWKHFLYSKRRNNSKCRECGTILKRDAKGSTTVLKRHLKKHETEIQFPWFCCRIRIWRISVSTMNLKMCHTSRSLTCGNSFFSINPKISQSVNSVESSWVHPGERPAPWWDTLNLNIRLFWPMIILLFLIINEHFSCENLKIYNFAKLQ